MDGVEEYVVAVGDEYDVCGNEAATSPIAKVPEPYPGPVAAAYCVGLL